MYKTKHFELYELVPKDFYESYRGNKINLWFLFDERLLITADSLRERYGSITINDWYWDKKNQYRGWRPLSCSIGSELSQHKLGRALDMIPSKVSAETIRKDILDNPFSDDFKFITCIEEEVSWLHFDVRNWDKKENGIFIVKRKIKHKKPKFEFV